MSRSLVDRHPDVAIIQRALALGTPLGALAKKYGLTKSALWRAKKRLPPTLKAQAARDALRPGADLERLRELESERLLANLASQRWRLLRAQDAASASAQYGVVAALGAQIHRNLQLVGRYLGEFANHSVRTEINLVLQPDYLRLRAAIVGALRAHPAARAAVTRALQEIEAEGQRRLEAASPPTIDGNATHVGA